MHTHFPFTHTYAPAANCPWHEHYCRLAGRHLKAHTLKPTLHFAVAPNKRRFACAELCTRTCAEIFQQKTDFGFLKLLCTLILSTWSRSRLHVYKLWFLFLKSPLLALRFDLSAYLRLPTCACVSVSEDMSERKREEAQPDDTVKCSMSRNSWQVTSHAFRANLWRQKHKQGRSLLRSEIIVGTVKLQS